MNALAGSVLVSMIFAGATSAMSAPQRQTGMSIPEFRAESSTFDRRTTPTALEQRFGRDTLLYFPMDRASAPVALEQVIFRVR